MIEDLLLEKPTWKNYTTQEDYWTERSLSFIISLICYTFLLVLTPDIYPTGRAGMFSSFFLLLYECVKFLCQSPLTVQCLAFRSYQKLDFFDVELTHNVTLVSGVQHKDSTSVYTVLSSPPAEPPPVPMEHYCSAHDHTPCAGPLPSTFKSRTEMTPASMRSLRSL